MTSATGDEKTPRTFGREPRRADYDAVVVGSGPNGLAAAITLARANRSVLLVEAQDEIGGGLRSSALTLPGYVHDHCSTIQALGLASPFFRGLDLEARGLHFDHPEAPCAHPLPDGSCAVAERSLEQTCAALGEDGASYRKLYAPLVEQADALIEQNLLPIGFPRHPLLMARFGMRAIRPAVKLARASFRSERTRGLFAGMAAHSILPLEQSFTSAIALMLSTTAHSRGWPVMRGGSQQLADALAEILESMGGEIVVGWKVETLAELPRSRAVLFDLAPRNVARIAQGELPAGYRRKLERFRHGPGVFKLDWALRDPIPWKAPECARAGTVHVGGTLEQIAAAERAPWEGRLAEEPFLLVVQATRFDPSRAPRDRHTGWAYCHVPAGHAEDCTEAVEDQMERYAPGFKDTILERCATSPADFEAANANLIGGDITGGVMDFRQLFTRPTARRSPYTTPSKRVFLCSASTPPGGGTHGMCGENAARAALQRVLRD